VLLPASREQIKKLGERLACGDPISDDDDHLRESSSGAGSFASSDHFAPT
jgi:hypothetical protein